jgi:hypothetical protein
LLKKRFAIHLAVLVFVVAAVGTSGPFSPSAMAASHVFTTTQVVEGLLHHPGRWQGKVVLVRGIFEAEFGGICGAGKSCPFHGGLSDTGMFVNLLTLRVTSTTRKLLVKGRATYRVRLHLGRYGTTLQAEGYLLGRLG